MKKKITSILTAVFLAVMLILPVSAQETPKLVEEDSVLTSEQSEKLRNKLEDISNKHNMDVVVLIKPQLDDGKTATECADDFYDYNGYKDDGILFLLSVNDRKWAISTKGEGITDFTQAGMDYIFEKMRGDLKDDEYYDALMTFAKQCDKFITHAEKSKPYDVGHMPIKINWTLVVISTVAGMIISFIIVSGVAAQLKTVNVATNASNYQKNGGVVLSSKRDVFSHRSLSKSKIEHSSSSGGSSSGGGGSRTHTSSSGSTHGGTSGSF